MKEIKSLYNRPLEIADTKIPPYKVYVHSNKDLVARYVWDVFCQCSN